MSKANKNAVPFHKLGSMGCGGFQHKTQCLKTNQKVYFYTFILQIFLLKPLFH